MIAVCIPGCGKLLGISDPTPADRTDGGGGDDGSTIDSSPPCVTPSTFKMEQSFAIGGTGLALVVGQLDRMPGRDVAIAVGDGVQIMSGNGSGMFTPGLKISIPQADGLVIGDFDNDGDGDLVVWDEGGTTIAAYRQDSSVTPSTYGAAQPLTGPFAGLQDARVGYVDALFIDDLLVKDTSGAWGYTSRQLNPIDFARSASPIPDIGGSDTLIAFGQLNGQGGDDAAFIGATGDIKIAYSVASLTPPQVFPAGARQRCVGFGKLDEDTEIDMIVGTAGGGVIYRGGGGTFAPVSGTIAAVTGPSMQVIDLNGDSRDDLLLASRIVYQCPPATPGGPGVFSQFDAIDAGGPALAVDVTGDGKPDLLRIVGTDLRVRVQQ
jgi:hypothetical protein